MVKKEEEKLTSEQKLMVKIENFFTLNKKLISIAGISLAVVLIALVVILAVSSSSKEKAMIRVSDLESQITALDAASDTFDSDADAILSELDKKTKGSKYSNIKALYLKGHLYFEKQDYQSAFDAFIACYEKNKKIYLAPLSLVNAGVCAEYLGDTAKAIEMYSLVSNYETSGVGAKALFGIARIKYTNGQIDEAKTYFEQIVENYQYSEYAAISKDVLATL